MVEDTLRPGDIILFCCKNVLSAVQRTLTRTQWDHIGMVAWDWGVSATAVLCVWSHGSMLTMMIMMLIVVGDAGYC